MRSTSPDWDPPSLCNLNKTSPLRLLCGPSPERRLNRPPLLSPTAGSQREDGLWWPRVRCNFGTAPPGCDPGHARRAMMRARPQVCEALLFALALQTGVCYGIKWL